MTDKPSEPVQGRCTHHDGNGLSTIRAEDFKRPHRGKCRLCHEKFGSTWMPPSGPNWFALEATVRELREENEWLREQVAGLSMDVANAGVSTAAARAEVEALKAALTAAEGKAALAAEMLGTMGNGEGWTVQTVIDLLTTPEEPEEGHA